MLFEGFPDSEIENHSLAIVVVQGERSNTVTVHSVLFAPDEFYRVYFWNDRNFNPFNQPSVRIERYNAQGFVGHLIVFGYNWD